MKTPIDEVQKRFHENSVTMGPLRRLISQVRSPPAYHTGVFYPRPNEIERRAMPGSNFIAIAHELYEEGLAKLFSRKFGIDRFEDVVAFAATNPIFWDRLNGNFLIMDALCINGVYQAGFSIETGGGVTVFRWRIFDQPIHRISVDPGPKSYLTRNEKDKLR